MQRRSGEKKRCLGQNVSLMVIDLIPWSEGKSGRRDYFFSSLFPFQNMKKKSKSILLFCSALLFFNSLVWLWLSLPLPPPSGHTRLREDLAKTADNLAWIKHSWVPLKRNKLTSDFSTYKAK